MPLKFFEAGVKNSKTSRSNQAKTAPEQAAKAATE
jgi:hypothetical protein